MQESQLSEQAQALTMWRQEALSLRAKFSSMQVPSCILPAIHSFGVEGVCACFKKLTLKWIVFLPAQLRVSESERARDAALLAEEERQSQQARCRRRWIGRGRSREFGTKRWRGWRKGEGVGGEEDEEWQWERETGIKGAGRIEIFRREMEGGMAGWAGEDKEWEF